MCLGSDSFSLITPHMTTETYHNAVAVDYEQPLLCSGFLATCQIHKNCQITENIHFYKLHFEPFMQTIIWLDKISLNNIDLHLVQDKKKVINLTSFNQVMLFPLKT